MWKYGSPIGTMYIRTNNQTGKYNLVINGKALGNYSSAVAAADDVYTHSTGCLEWDMLDGTIADVPTDIYQWQKV